MDTGALKTFAREARRSLIARIDAKLTHVLADGSPERREAPAAVGTLEKLLKELGREQVVEKVAYTWFNRLSALRFMDANDYNVIKVVSPAEGGTRPEILAEAIDGHIDRQIPERIRERVLGLLNGREVSKDRHGEAYRLLLVATCNRLSSVMPFMFERIADYTELLIPSDLLSNDGILTRLRETMTVDACKDVEVIGWLYQFYISEKKDAVFSSLKNNIKISAENIPAATQLFTPHWIVRYLVENSLGRLWMLNRPTSKVIKKMDYYIPSEDSEKDFIRISGPEEIRICDPACGSGHMLTYAFDLLHSIYEEEGYDAHEIPALILANNLTGIEIDDRAGTLAAFALAMKAAAYLGWGRFQKMKATPNICVMQDVSFTAAEMEEVAAMVGKDLFTADLRETMGQFEQAKNFGSLIIPKLQNPAQTLRVIEARDFGTDLLLKEVQARIFAVLRMVDALSSKYHIVLINPPYASIKNMNKEMQIYAKNIFPSNRADLYAMFIERSLIISMSRGFASIICMQSWMFLGAFEEIREKITSTSTIVSMAHVGERGFDAIGGAVVSTTAFILKKAPSTGFHGTFICLTEGNSELEKSLALLAAKRGERTDITYVAGTDQFSQIPGGPVSYWMTEEAYAVFAKGTALAEFSKGSTGLQTSDSDRFLRLLAEVNASSVGRRWFPFAKGGGYRRWFGNVEHVVNWENDGNEIKTYVAKKYPYLNGNYALVVKNEGTYFQKGMLTSRVTSGPLSFRMKSSSEIYADACTAIFPAEHDKFIALLNSKIITLVRALNPTMNFQASDIEKFPVLYISDERCEHNAVNAIEIARNDWDSYEKSWNFNTLPLLSPAHKVKKLEKAYARLRAHWQGMTGELRRLEEENNRVFIDAYGLKEELIPEVPLEEITLTCNPAYSIKGAMDEATREERLLSRTVAEFLHYAVGCMFGRYSPDVPGLILANQGEGLNEYLARVPNPSFEPDDDNVIPVLEGEWFADDVSDRFRKFLRVTFGDENFQENLNFIELALGKTVRKWFVRDFYKFHVKMYSNRPIYWMFSSPNGTFNALIYMHRYKSDTVSILLNDYVREFKRKLEGERDRLKGVSVSADVRQGEKTKAMKEIAALTAQIHEMEAWERDVLLPLAQQKVEIDLDDGVKANYPKFGTALRFIKGLGEDV